MRVIAIDGPAGSGKSTVARALATRLGLRYLDTGAMYRSVAFAAMRRGIDIEEADSVGKVARDLDLRMGDDGTITVDGVDATIEIRGPEVTRAVSIVAANPEVRKQMRQRQREWATKYDGGVLEGRDIGTVVFPDAELKVFLVADPWERARRRLIQRLGHHPSEEEIAAETDAIVRRDAKDATQTMQATDAILIDTTYLTQEEQVERIVALAKAVTRRPDKTSAVDG
jgi:cytidylate kinase